MPDCSSGHVHDLFASNCVIYRNVVGRLLMRGSKLLLSRHRPEAIHIDLPNKEPKWLSTAPG